MRYEKMAWVKIRCKREHLAFFFRDVMVDVLDQRLKLGIELVRIIRHPLQFLNELVHGLVFLHTFFDQVWPLIDPLVHRRVENVFFKLCVGSSSVKTCAASVLLVSGLLVASYCANRSLTR
jgi:hypothetical protein